MQDEPVRVLRQTYVYRGKVVNVRVDEIVTPRHPEGARFEVVEYAPAVTILPLLSDGRVVLTRQYRHALRDWILELPAGKRDPGEPSLDAARRELEEETGYRGGNWTFLLSYYVAPGYSTEKMDFWVARDLEAGRPHLDPDEWLETVVMPMEEVYRRLVAGDWVDAKTFIGLSYFFLTDPEGQAFARSFQP